MKDRFEVTVRLKQIAVAGSGVGSDWEFELSAGGLKWTGKKHISANSSASFSGKSGSLGVLTFDHYLDGRVPFRLQFDCTEVDPVFNDHGSGVFDGPLTLRPSTVVPRTVEARVSAVGGDAGNSVTVEAWLECSISLVGAAKLVPTPDWWTVFKWANEYGVPTGILRAVMDAGIEIREDDSLGSRAGQYSSGVISLATDLYKELSSGRLTAEVMGVIYNEVFHAWFDRVLGSDSWIRELIAYEASNNYSAGLTNTEIGRDLHVDMVEEAMSETFESLVNHIVSAKRRSEVLTTLGPSYSEHPAHTSNGQAFANVSKAALVHAGKKLGDDHYYVTLYTLYYQDDLPPGGAVLTASQPSAIAAIIKQLESAKLKLP